MTSQLGDGAARAAARGSRRRAPVEVGGEVGDRLGVVVHLQSRLEQREPGVHGAGDGVAKHLNLGTGHRSRLRYTDTVI